MADRVDRETVRWAYRLYLDREPESEDVVQQFVSACGTTRDLRRAFMSSAEFRGANPKTMFFAPVSARVLTEIGHGVRLFVDLSDTAIGANVAFGNYERPETEWIEAHVSAGDTVVDIGANIGYFTMLMARAVGPGGRVHAFEPVSENADLLERSVAENRFGDRVVIHRTALGNVPGAAALATLALAAGSQNSGGSFLAGAADVPSGHEKRIVAVSRLDDIVFGDRVSLVKIDVEGAEPLVFDGASGLLKRDAPWILSEINAVQLRRVSGATPRELIRLMDGLGYDCLALESGEPLEDHASETVCSVVFRPRRRG